MPGLDHAKREQSQFGHHHLLAVTPHWTANRSTTSRSSGQQKEEQTRRYCRVPSNFPREQLMTIKGNFSVSGQFCHQLIKGNKRLQMYVKDSLKHWRNSVQDYTFLLKLLKNCSETHRDFVHSYYSSKYEEDFPVAFEMLIYYKKTRIQQYIRLLKNIYRPHNWYCIHIDKKSPAKWTKMVRQFASCLPNVIITKVQMNVEYARSSILYAHFECFKELMAVSRKWKYIISLHGTELPLTTNRDIVTILRNMNGSNLISRGVTAKDLSGKAQQWLTFKVKSIHNGKWVQLTNDPLGPVPYNMTLYKSAASANSAFSRQFIHFILTNKKAVALSQYLNEVHSGVEFFFSTMNALPEAPGGFDSIVNEARLPLVVQRDWTHVIKNHRYLCKGRKLVHNICIVSSGDLPRLYKASCDKLWLFHNKYFMEYDHVVMDCMEKILLQRNHHEYIQDCRRTTVTRMYVT